MSHQSGETLNNKISWQFHNSQLLKILNIAWHSLSPGSSKEAISNIQTILTVFNPDSIPYRNSAGKYKHRLSTYMSEKSGVPYKAVTLQSDCLSL